MAYETPPMTPTTEMGLSIVYEAESVLQCVAVCCSVLHCTAIFYSVVQYEAEIVTQYLVRRRMVTGNPS